ncbi:MAG: RloB family protein [Bacteroidales bacterium]|nr:RloB family protein [Bacteroidales bacterium]
MVVIAAEGRDTENIYFEAMKDSLCASNVHVEVLHRDTDDSSPENVFDQIKVFRTEYNIEEDDELWVVVDKDHWPKKMLASIAQHCANNRNLRFCVSNPCFELWLLLHLEDVSLYDDDTKRQLCENKKTSKGRSSDTWLKKRMKRLLGRYHESDYDVSVLLPNIQTAIDRAQNLDVCPKDRWPQTVGTRVYLLARSIMGEDA